ncbi:phosphoglycerate kinase [Leptospira borgpetersenii]|uniref:phosphoglycerate kinase n=1 Tax=Leptospira borgpetersenii TaxID=174 RepID=UPI0007745E37|nr:phosphoglycerate kinase [Leptospira borgpetersenii]MBE8399360.1 phosphoglycerate kinase [Leptospira borgpetersenii serovar Tarassovi]MBE8402391.1 phosphoglycerate kinase [Leptospira borgpetersenii serovar Tarassovi]MBE8405516.1 phosphoglycerate kinase [Leptospira borgpetersenii serovar Tarassovi]MBE8411651.1 phosphoglycerate kinase [Leptospira borgpetersenii serovar Tarassovi]MBE8414864.1 phosphoglycerate kinase [Leptospira borgpetersenii serovar Tarassovi]
MELPRLENVDLSGKKVFLRVDFNVPIENGKVTDKTRIEKTLPTIELLIKKGARIIIASHLGRPKGQTNPEFSLAPVVEVFKELVKSNVYFSKTVIGDEPIKLSKELRDGEILVIENVRFHKEEEENEPGFSKKLAALADVYVNDAFGAAHRAHASTEGIAHLLPAYAGLLMHKEIVELSALLAKPARPFVAIIGGSKVSSKIKVLNNLFDKVNHLLIGGGMAYTFLKSRAVPVGNSLVEKDFEVQAFQLIEKAGVAGVDLQLPVDHIIGDQFNEKAKTKSVDKMGILDGWMGMDIGSKTVSNYEKIIKNAGTIFWNGPMGVFEMDKFAGGTMAIAKAISKSKAKTVVGGGDSIAAINKAKVADKITHISTGGGASLEFMEGRKLPGVEALKKKVSE